MATQSMPHYLPAWGRCRELPGFRHHEYRVAFDGLSVVAAHDIFSSSASTTPPADTPAQRCLCGASATLKRFHFMKLVHLPIFRAREKSEF